MNKLCWIFLCLLSLTNFVSAQRIIPLYEKNAIPFAKVNTDTPTLAVYVPEKTTATRGTAVIVCSGGAYRGRANSVEGLPAIKKLVEAGITAFLLDYRLPKSDKMDHKELVPLTDAQRAFQYVREHAEEYNLDIHKVGIMGFSAGGHLVSTVGTHFSKTVLDNPEHTSLRPDFLVLVYPVISFADSLTHLLSRTNLIGPDYSVERIREYSNELQVTDSTPPAYITHGLDDKVVKVENSLYFQAALLQHHVPVQLFLYEKGAHGFGVYNRQAQVQWINDCISWIKKEEWLTHNDSSAPEYKSPLTTADWISPSFAEPVSNRPSLVFHKTFNLNKPVSEATLYVTAHGLYEALINGKRVGDGYFTPGFTAYQKRLQYQVYDVKQLLNSNNEIQVTVGDGWWRGRFGNSGNINNYGEDASLLLILIISYTDGTQDSLRSDSGWQVSTGPIVASEIYDGETYNANLSAKNWQPVVIRSFSKNNLVPMLGEPVRKQEVFKPKAIINSNILDFGQNLAGWVRFTVRGKKGDTIRVSHAEALDKEGHFFTGNLRTAKAMDIYILTGEGAEIFEPHFTYHGFRYAKVEGCNVNKNDFEAIALYTDLKKTGSFSCSDTRINQLQNNIEWSMKSNFFDIPTDCPQRSERFGWTEDADVFCSTAAYLMNVKDFYRKWLADLMAEQNENGCVPATAPIMWGDNKRGIAGWSDAMTFTPWTLYQHYGDTTILSDHYASMKAWVEYVRRVSPDYLWKANGFGDWYPAGPPTDLPYLDQCYWYRSTWILLQAAQILGKQEDINTYAQLLQNIKAAFDKTYANNIPNTQTAYVVGLAFGLLPKEKITNLANLVRVNNNHLATGFMGTPYIMHVLSNFGEHELAWKLFYQDDVPSWLYMVNKGATTMWEKWDAIRSDDSIQAVSLNHYAFGSIGSWMYENIAGIKPAAPGYKQIIIQPHVGGGLTWAKGSYDCKYGKIVSEWKISGKRLIMNVIIPPNTTAIIYVPGKNRVEVGPGKYVFKGIS